MPEQPIYTVDAFTDRAFAGNPAGVCILKQPASEAWMRAVAAEMNLSETAFLHPEAEAWRLRWFTPTVEMDLCGHATLASAHVLWQTEVLASDVEARFMTRSGLLKANRRGAWIELDFPANPAEPVEPPAEMLAALGATPTWVGKSRFDYLVEVASEDEVRAVQPDFARLRQTPARGVIVTSRAATRDCDFVSRFFAPAAGVDEDPVTGSAHCTLAPYWAAKLGKREMLAQQLSARGGVLRLQLQGERLRMSGQAVTVLRGELLAAPPSA